MADFIENPKMKRSRLTCDPNHTEGLADDTTVETTDETTLMESSSVLRMLSEGSWNDLFIEFVENRSSEEMESLVVATIMHFASSLVDKVILERVVHYIAGHYNSNHYHSFRHGIHVFVNVAHLLSQLHVPYSPVESLAVLYSALIHDAGHLGVPNSTLVNNSHPLAISYNDQSVAEMHSVALGLNILESDPSMALLSKLSVEEKRIFREFVVELVLCTDIADRYKKDCLHLRVSEFMKSTSETDESSNHILDISQRGGRIGLGGLLLRCADVGSSLQCGKTSVYWARQFFYEICSNQLRSTGKPCVVTNCFNLQIAFLDSHTLDIARRVQDTSALKSSVSEQMFKSVAANRAQWIENGMKLLNGWLVSPIIADLVEEIALNTASSENCALGTSPSN